MDDTAVILALELVSMPIFNKQQCEFLLGIQNELQAYLRDTIRWELGREVGYGVAVPQEVARLEQELRNLAELLQRGSQGEGIRFDDGLNGLIKSAVLRSRRAAAVRIDEHRQDVIAQEQLEDFDRQLARYDEFLSQPWFQEATPRRIPRLTDFITVTRVEAALRLEQVPREYDQKFRVLLSPGLISADLDYYRRSCRLRDRPVALAYLDIDDFKTFNTKYTETVVDRDVLPFFARALESHVYARGHAYQKGGDEYVVILPNADEALAVRLLQDLQATLANLQYRGITEATAISIGLCVADPECVLTNAEMEARANEAKNFAKGQGKNRIASYRAALFRPQDLYIASAAA